MINLTAPKELQQKNRQIVVDNLQRSHDVIERLIQKTYHQQDVVTSSQLRQIRSRATVLLSDIQDKNLDSFSGREGGLEQFYESEQHFLESSNCLLKTLQEAMSSGDSIDTFSLESLVDAVENGFRNRIIPTKGLLLEYESRRKEFRKNQVKDNAENLGSNVEFVNGSHEVTDEKKSDEIEFLSKFYNYINLLEHKYSRFQPEISNNGDYIADKGWNFDLTKKSIYGTVKDGLFKKPLVFETYWHPLTQMSDAVEYVQSQASSVNRDQYKSLCLVANTWNDDIKEFARCFVHSRMSFFLYELESDTLVFNETSESADHFKFWHSSEMKKVTLDQEMSVFVDEVEYFTVEDVEKRFGLNSQGAERFLGQLLKKGMIIDVGFGSAKYAKSKQVW